MLDFSGNNDEEEESEFAYDIKKGYRGSSPMTDTSDPPIISYKFIDLDKTEYNFHRPEFDGRDRRIYFEKLKSFAEKSVDSLMNNTKHNEHFTISERLSTKERELVEKLTGVKITHENAPVLGHFALYTPEITKEILVDIKAGKDVPSPRIFFLFDKACVFHILFYDPFHRIHPMGKETIESLEKQLE